MQPDPGRADRDRMRVLGGLLGAFVGGGVVGAYGFKRLGYGFTVPLAVALRCSAVV